MKSHADSFYTIGHNHIVDGIACQDYALVMNTERKGQTLLVADGCSSSPDTDIGARILSHVFKRICKDMQLNPRNMKACIAHAKEVATMWFALSQECLDVSLVLIQYRPNETNRNDIFVSIYGDGAFFVSQRDFNYEIISVNWDQNAPPYLNYFNDPERYKALIDSKQAGKVVTEMGDSFDSVKSVLSHEITIEDSLYGRVSYVYSSEDVLFISAMTDGIEQIGSLPKFDAACKFNDFKNVTGNFVKRRAIKVLKDLGKENHFPKDDFSIATMYFDRDQ